MKWAENWPWEANTPSSAVRTREEGVGGSLILELEERKSDLGRGLREATCAWRAAGVLQCLTTATTEC